MTAAKIVLAGNPNCGKTALFNALTGSSQRVGNWPGVTVDCKQGTMTIANQTCSVLDLPGVYSLFSYGDQCALDTKIACDYLLSEPVDLIVNVLDAANLERHLYLTTQLLDLGLPMVIALNMMDVLERRGGGIDCAALAKRLGCPVIPIIASQGHNIDALQSSICQQLKLASPSVSVLNLPPAVQSLRNQICADLTDYAASTNTAFMTLRLLEGDSCSNDSIPGALLQQLHTKISACQQTLEHDIDLIITDVRYQWCARVRREALTLKTNQRRNLTQRMDAIFLHRWLAFPLFLMVMYAMFFFAINVGGAFQDFFDIGSTTIFVQGCAHLLYLCHAPGWLIAILADGMGKGINTTITFIPMIIGLFLFLSFLEDSGYMARATFIMDRLMRALGLPGEAFVPMIVGFGCNVPAVMGARTLSNMRDRILTVVMMPFMSCGARFAIFTVFAAAFFPVHGALIIFLLYLLGIISAIVTGVVFRKTCLRGTAAPLVLELPPYHRPQWQSLWRLTYRRTRAFVVRAGKVIVPVCVVLGVLNALTFSGHVITQEANTHSILSWLGRMLTPIFQPLGVHSDNWPATVGLATGVLAKEVVIGSLNSLYAAQAHLLVAQASFHFWAGLQAALWSIPQNIKQLVSALGNPIAASAADVSMSTGAFGVMVHEFGSKSAAFAYLVFVLLYFPCVSTLAAMQREVGHSWALISMGWSCGFAYSLAVICYQVMQIAQQGWAAIAWVGAMMGLLALMVWLLTFAMRPNTVTGKVHP